MHTADGNTLLYPVRKSTAATSRDMKTLTIMDEDENEDRWKQGNYQIFYRRGRKFN